MTPENVRPLTDADIERLGIEAGMRVLAMPESPSQDDIDRAVLDLGTDALPTEPTMPEGVTHD